MTIPLLEKRDRILSSLRDQFKAKVSGINLILADGERSMVRADDRLCDSFLLDLANNIAQGLADEDDE